MKERCCCHHQPETRTYLASHHILETGAAGAFRFRGGDQFPSIGIHDVFTIKYTATVFHSSSPFGALLCAVAQPAQNLFSGRGPLDADELQKRARGTVCHTSAVFCRSPIRDKLRKDRLSAASGCAVCELRKTFDRNLVAMRSSPFEGPSLLPRQRMLLSSVVSKASLRRVRGGAGYQRVEEGYGIHYGEQGMRS
eukprot:scaffold94_cov340-Prasinococcus_capsulatus_cf.AAC.18